MAGNTPQYILDAVAGMPAADGLVVAPQEAGDTSSYQRTEAGEVELIGSTINNNIISIALTEQEQADLDAAEGKSIFINDLLKDKDFGPIPRNHVIVYNFGATEVDGIWSGYKTAYLWTRQGGAVLFADSSTTGNVVVDKLTEVSEVPDAVDGQMVQVTSFLPAIVYYVYNENAATGLLAKGKAGKWNRAGGNEVHLISILKGNVPTATDAGTQKMDSITDGDLTTGWFQDDKAGLAVTTAEYTLAEAKAPAGMSLEVSTTDASGADVLAATVIPKLQLIGGNLVDGAVVYEDTPFFESTALTIPSDIGPQYYAFTTDTTYTNVKLVLDRTGDTENQMHITEFKLVERTSTKAFQINTVEEA